MKNVSKGDREVGIVIDTDADETSKCVGIWENQPKTKEQKKSSKSDTTRKFQNRKTSK